MLVEILLVYAHSIINAYTMSTWYQWPCVVLCTHYMYMYIDALSQRQSTKANKLLLYEVQCTLYSIVCKNLDKCSNLGVWEVDLKARNGPLHPHGGQEGIVSDYTLEQLNLKPSGRDNMEGRGPTGHGTTPVLSYIQCTVKGLKSKIIGSTYSHANRERAACTFMSSCT